MGPRSRKHHYVPRLLLRGFANERDQIATLELDGRTYVQPVGDAAAERDYNTVRLDDDELTPTDEAEQLISQMEGYVAPLIERIRSGGWLEDEVDVLNMAFFVTYQYLRVPRSRELNDALAEETAKLQMAADGPLGIRRRAEAAGERLTDDEVWAQWEAVRDFDWTVKNSPEHQVISALRSADEFHTAVAFGYEWHVMRFARRSLVTSDSPVVLTPGEGHPPWAGVGLLNASQVLLALDRHTLLLLFNRAGQTMPGVELQPTVTLARRANRLTAATASKRLFHHPDDAFDALFGSGWDLPPATEEVLHAAGGDELRTALVEAGEEAFRNPDKPHPWSRRAKG